jgi:hypothetical protein
MSRDYKTAAGIFKCPIIELLHCPGEACSWDKLNFKQSIVRVFLKKLFISKLTGEIYG